MRKSSLLTTITCFVFVHLFGQQTLKETIYFGDNSGNLRMFHFSPDSTTTAKKPLLIILHGCGQSAEDIAELGGWNKLASLHNFMIVYPQQKIANNPNLCFNWFNKWDTDKDQGEVASIREMIRYAVKNLQADSTQIFTAGFSAGGAMSASLLATYPDVFKAGAVFAGGPYQLALTAKEGAKAMLGNINLSKEELKKRVMNQHPNGVSSFPKLIVVQGLKDNVVDPKNAYLLVNQWIWIQQSPLTSTKSTPLESYNALQRTSYIDNSGNEQIVFYEIEDLGHRVLIDPGTLPTQGGKKGLFSVDKDWHSSYHIAVDLGIIK